MKEETATVLDYLPHGYPFDSRPSHKKSPIVQALGLNHFTLLELVPKKDVTLQPGENIYIGAGKRDKIHHIVGKLTMDNLTPTANSELEYTVKDVVDKNEDRFIRFFNEARPLSTRMHQLELIPGVGKKHMWDILEKRDEKAFESFEDLRNRVKLLPEPKKAIVKRIMNEMTGNEKYNIFVD